ncbi:hypothetical protein L798_04451 [Zootermopsis nevadensis]|uniref:Uncharacterized protein n=1 Tax=Zootermopsis nevadensis TaxID=136037 RepID=A0A067RCL7_ZOONE|nr:hypothetical protein L798_04451 [Zootermopsis nevadensis]
MSADQINRILGGFMSRHNPSYSSKYKAEETTVSADTTDSTTATVGADSSGIGTPSNGTDSEVNVSRTESRISSTLSGDKSFQKARVIPIIKNIIDVERGQNLSKGKSYSNFEREGNS